MIGKRAFLSFVVFFASVYSAFGAATTPTNVNLTADMNSVTVTWSGNSSTDDGYYVYWGTSSTDISQQEPLIDKNTYTYTISGLDSATTYYVQITAEYKGVESIRTTEQHITTTIDTPPAVPSGLAVSGEVSGSSVTLTWTANTESDLDKYTIHYGTNAGALTSTKDVDASTAPQTTMDGLVASTRYYFAVSAIDTAGNKSANSAVLTVDTLVDNFPPDVPGSISAVVSGIGEISVTIDPGNDQMHDFAGVYLYYSSLPGGYVDPVDLGVGTSYVLTGLEQDSTWYFAASAYDTSGNESLKTAEVSTVVERTTGFLDSTSGFDGGCFISTVSSGKKDRVEKKNRAGVSVGYLWTAEKDFKSFYGKDRYPVFVFYDRDLFSHVSAEISAGFMRRSGNLRTVSGAGTGISSTMTLVPVAASLDYNFGIISHVKGFIGAGTDYWYVNEKPDATGFQMDTKEWVGGYHGHAGVWLYNEDPAYADWGVKIEGNYAKIDRFGNNDTDIGGWIFDMGFFYRF
ncbi:MAG: fibronectin type III domain-containing protein [Deltaproteobacteria bacterium]|nr:fibronectin type III domain-containing protein [Deltaproteobacteria bacterium]